jgi:hypothetical protein
LGRPLGVWPASAGAPTAKVDRLVQFGLPIRRDGPAGTVIIDHVQGTMGEVSLIRESPVDGVVQEYLDEVNCFDSAECHDPVSSPSTLQYHVVK